jgi:hypothetical protein
MENRTLKEALEQQRSGDVSHQGGDTWYQDLFQHELNEVREAQQDASLPFAISLDDASTILRNFNEKKQQREESLLTLPSGSEKLTRQPSNPRARSMQGWLWKKSFAGAKNTLHVDQNGSKLAT